MLQIAIVCLGNICRSPMAQVVLEKKLADAGLDDRVTVVSAGTGGWHTGEPMDPRAAATLAEAGYDPSRHIARRFTTDWYAENDVILVMDAANHADAMELAPDIASSEKLRMFRIYDPEASESDDEVPDPWFGGSEGFQQVLQMVERTAEALVEELVEDLTGR